MKWLALVAIVVVGNLIYLNRPDHKYRLTIDIQTPDGIKSGSSVIAVYHAKDGGIIPGVGGGTGIKGDAIFIDLGGGRNLVALLVRGEHASYLDGMDDLALRAFHAAGYSKSVQDVGASTAKNLSPAPSSRRLLFSDVKNLTGTVSLTGTLIPTLATLKDVTNPKSIVEVSANDLVPVFGPGYRIESASLTMLPVGLWPFDFGSVLGEPVTRGIEKKLPFLVTHREQLRRIYDDMPPRLKPHFHFFTR
ncbi:MAG: hypothetical protein BGP05_06165 [Rhizobiales bacterium 62-47]|nr:hypothetical protein [Hyphomicrobiales bacterium]OJY08452.1 MAG: hypothetical protein BGP05_06165 [Rhizobiales bacterium 62-47]